MTLSEKELQDIIDKTVNDTINKMAVKNMIRGQEKTAKEKTEQLLKSYENFCKIIQDKQEKIEEIEACGGLHQKSKSYINYISSDGMRTELDVTDIIANLQNSIEMTAQLVSVIEMALDTVADNEYFDCIRYRYFPSMRKKRVEIADIYNTSEIVITRKTNELLDKITTFLFTNDVIIGLLA